MKRHIADMIKERILLLDGSMGVMLQQLNLDEAKFRGRRFVTHPFSLKGDYDVLCLTRPDLVASVHRAYLEAGADIIETNTFNANCISQRCYGLEKFVGEINYQGARIARREADRFMSDNSGSVKFVAGSIGPTVEACGDLPQVFMEQAIALLQGGVDILLVETFFDVSNAEAAMQGIVKAQQALATAVPVVISAAVSCDTHKLYSGHTLDEFEAAVASFNPLCIGLNCSGTPSDILPAFKSMALSTGLPLILYPNAGLPDKTGEYHESPEEFAESLADVVAKRECAVIGGCCGTTPEHIAALSSIIRFLP